MNDGALTGKKSRRRSLLLILSFMLGLSLYGLAAYSTFTYAQPGASGVSVIAVVALLSITGSGVVVLAYGFVLILGGRISVRLAEFIGGVTKSTHVVELLEKPPLTTREKLKREALLLSMPALVYGLSVTLAWDVHNLHDPRTSIFHPLLHTLDVFSRPVNIDPISYSVDLIPIMVLLIAIAGVIPSLTLPYFRKFRITGVNSAPFHTNLLSTVAGAVVGLGALLTLIGFIYRVLWVGQGPVYYHFVLAAMLGFSFHYTAGTFLGREKSERMIRTTLETGRTKRVIVGSVSVQRVGAGHQEESPATE